MLNKDVFFKGMEDLIIFFPNWNIKVDDIKVTKAWYSMFEKCSDEEFKKIIYGYIENESFPPTVVGLKKYNLKKEFNPWSNIES